VPAPLLRRSIRVHHIRLLLAAHGATVAFSQEVAGGAGHVCQPRQEPGGRRRPAARRTRAEGRGHQGGAVPDLRRRHREGRRVQGGTSAGLPGAVQAVQEPRSLAVLVHAAALPPLLQRPGHRRQRPGHRSPCG
jgi:hypothetical protein